MLSRHYATDQGDVWIQPRTVARAISLLPHAALSTTTPILTSGCSSIRRSPATVRGCVPPSATSSITAALGAGYSTTGCGCSAPKCTVTKYGIPGTTRDSRGCNRALTGGGSRSR